MVMRLVDHVEQGPLWRLHGFLRGLAVTNQEYMIGVLGLDQAVYEDPPTPDFPPPSISASPQGLNVTQKQHFRRSDSDEMLPFPVAPLPGMSILC